MTPVNGERIVRPSLAPVLTSGQVQASVPKREIRVPRWTREPLVSFVLTSTGSDGSCARG